MNELDKHNITCEFCAQDVKFINSRQVTLKIDKSNSYQNLFAIICKDCEIHGKKKTIHGQTLKTITNTNKFKDEESVFDGPDGE